MHIESSALQQRFVPQPIMRSSWLQLVMFSFEPDISLIDPRDALRPRMTLGETLGLNPNMTIVYLSFSDCLPSQSFPYLLFLSSFPGLTGESLDCRLKSGNDSGRRGLTRKSIRERSLGSGTACRPRMTRGETLGLNPNTMVFLWAAVFLPVEKMLLTLI